MGHPDYNRLEHRAHRPTDTTRTIAIRDAQLRLRLAAQDRRAERRKRFMRLFGR